MIRALVALLALLALAGCRQDEVRPGLEGLSSFEVVVLSQGGLGSEEEPLPVPRGITKIRIGATAIGFDGQPFPWNGRARVTVTPGKTIPSVFPIEFQDGVAEAEVSVLGVHTDTRIWVVDDVEQEGAAPSNAVGVTPNIRFDEPTLADANQIPPNGDNNESFYPGDFVEMHRVGDPLGDGPVKRDLLVTAVTSTGFYVTDLSEPAHPTLPGNFGHIFVFNFSFPEGLEPGSRLEWLQGTLTDFSGSTQLSFPAYWYDGRGPFPEALAELEANAPAIDTTVCTGGSSAYASMELCGYSSNNMQMESLESAVVRIPEVKTPELWARCDFDGDGQVSSFVQTGDVFGCLDPSDAECACNAACLTSGVFPAADGPFEAEYADKAFDARNKVCAELTTYHAYGQYAVRTVEGGSVGPRINLQTRDAVPGFDPLLPENFGSRLSMRGVLQQVRAARPRWLVMARDASDLCCVDSESCPAGLELCK